MSKKISKHSGFLVLTLSVGLIAYIAGPRGNQDPCRDKILKIGDALSRYSIANATDEGQQYPERLESLVPDYLPAADWENFEYYRRQDRMGYLLVSTFPDHHGCQARETGPSWMNPDYAASHAEEDKP